MRISDWSSDVCSSDLRPVQTVDACWFQDRPVYRLFYESTAWLGDAANGKSVLVDSVIASGIAAEDYAGNGVASEPEWMTVATLEVRDHEAPIWRVPFEDGEGTTLYVSGQDGRVLERRNDTWRRFAFVWMPNIMEYTGGKDSKKPTW